MAVVTSASGTNTLTLDTPLTLATKTGVKSYMVQVDLKNMVAGDRLVVTIQIKVLTGSTSAILIEDVILGDDVVGGSQTPVYYSPPIPSMFEMIAKLEQTDGTGRSFEWAVLEI